MMSETRAVAFCALFLLSAAAAKSEDAKPRSQAFVELTCDPSGTAKLRTLSSMQIQPAWQDPSIGATDPISLTRQVMRIRDWGGKERPIWTVGSLTPRMARCRAGRSEVVVRITEDFQNAGYEEEVHAYVRVWIDRR